jgi:hypothetical protein
MIGQTISHYPASWDSAYRRDSRKQNKILENPGEVPKFPTPACVPSTLAGRSASQRAVGILSISCFLDSASRAGFQKAEPTFSVGNYGEGDL